MLRSIINGPLDPKAYSYLLVALGMLGKVMGGILKCQKLSDNKTELLLAQKGTTTVEHSQHRKLKPLHYNKMANPAKNPAIIRPKPYTWPISIIVTRPGAAPLGFPVCAEPSPKPVYTALLPPLVLLAVALIVEMVEVLGGRGF